MDKPVRLSSSVCLALRPVIEHEAGANQAPREKQICSAATLRSEASEEVIAHQTKVIRGRVSQRRNSGLAARQEIEELLARRLRRVVILRSLGIRQRKCPKQEPPENRETSTRCCTTSLLRQIWCDP